MNTPKLSLSYVCTDRGIPIDSDKGAAVHFREFGAALRRQGATVHALARRRNRKAALPFECVDFDPPRRRGDSSDLAHEIESFANQASALAACAELPACHAVYERYSLFGLAGLHHARRRGVPFLLEVNAPLWEEASRYRGLHFGDLAREVGRSLLREADHVFAVSPILRQRLIDVGVEPSRAHVLLNGVSDLFLKVRTPSERPRALHGRPVLVFVGSLKPWHGIEFLLAALRDPRATFGLWIVGDGPLRETVEAAAREHPTRIHYEGPLPHPEIAAVLQAADVAVAPYHSDSPDYFCPLKVFEALVAGIPLLAASVPAVRTVLPRGSNAHLFAASSLDSFFEVLPRALSAPRNVHSAGFRPREHTWDARAAQVLAILEDAPDEAAVMRT